VFPWDSEWHGRLDKRTVESQALRGNPLGDPHVRPVYVYVPPGYDDEPDRRYPAVYVLHGFPKQVDQWLDRDYWGGRNYPELADELFGAGAAPRCIVVFVDAWTRYGGSQYVDSPAVGRYSTYLCDDVVSWVDSEYRTVASPGARGIQGHSSGGYGALVNAMRRPDVFGAVAAHAPDGVFEYAYLADVPKAARALIRDYDGSADRFWDDFWARPPEGRRADGELVGILCLAACYSANDDGTYELPFDRSTGQFRADVWERWLAHDPVRLAREHADALRGLRGIYVDAGTRDEFFLDVGAAALRDVLAELGVDAHVELFDGPHAGIDHRYPVGLRFLAETLAS
jgi:S-formylglutathione hydrolase FrmB